MRIKYIIGVVSWIILKIYLGAIEEEVEKSKEDREAKRDVKIEGEIESKRKVDIDKFLKDLKLEDIKEIKEIKGKVNFGELSEKLKQKLKDIKGDSSEVDVDSIFDIVKEEMKKFQGNGKDSNFDRIVERLKEKVKKLKDSEEISKDTGFEKVFKQEQEFKSSNDNKENSNRAFDEEKDIKK